MKRSRVCIGNRPQSAFPQRHRVLLTILEAHGSGRAPVSLFLINNNIQEGQLQSMGTVTVSGRPQGVVGMVGTGRSPWLWQLGPAGGHLGVCVQSPHF